jgi:hypothetical protein
VPISVQRLDRLDRGHAARPGDAFTITPNTGGVSDGRNVSLLAQLAD